MRRLAIALASIPVLSIASYEFVRAAGVERTLPSATRILFEDGTYGEIGLTYTDPYQRGNGVLLPPEYTFLPDPVPVSGQTRDVFEPYWSFSAAFRSNITDTLSYALTLEPTYGADTAYGLDTFSFVLPWGAPFTYADTSAKLDSQQITGVLAYDIRPDIKLYGGLKALRTSASADIPFLGAYTVDTDADWGTGYLIGAAYSRPEIALRVALTYGSKIKIRYDTDEWDAFNGTTEVTFPQTVDLEFQTGITPKTLFYGSIRWAEWSEFEMAPEQYMATFGEPLVKYENDYTTYTIGIGRQLTERLAGSLSVIHEPSQGGSPLNTLGPYDGRTLGSAALSYDFERFNVTGGMVYGRLGDTSNAFDTAYDDGAVWGAGLRVGYQF